MDLLQINPISGMQVFESKSFWEIDFKLKKGHHFSDTDIDSWEFLQTGKEELQKFYERGGATLIYDQRGFVYLDFRSSKFLSKSRLDPLDMVIGFTVALLDISGRYTDSNGRIPFKDIYNEITESAPGFIKQRYKMIGTDQKEKQIESEVVTGLNRLKRYGFLTETNGNYIATKALARFVDLTDRVDSQQTENNYFEAGDSLE